MDQIDDHEDIASDEEVNNVDAEPIDSEGDPDDLDLTTLDLDDPKSDPNKKYQVFNGSQWQKIKKKEEEEQRSMSSRFNMGQRY